MLVNEYEINFEEYLSENKFKYCENGVWYLSDNKNNIVNINRYGIKEATLMLDSLVNCIDCKNCSDCLNCVFCENCENCVNCVSCYDCIKCYICNFSEFCERCYECDKCYSCYDCINCIECKNCIDCVECLCVNNYEKMNFKRQHKLINTLKMFLKKM